MAYSDLPKLNAVLNASSAILLGIGYALIRARRVAAHRVAMSGALVVSAVFLTSYLIYHAKVGSVRYQGHGPMRALYFAILISHTSLAVLNVPLIVRTFFLAWKERFEEHRRLARWTFPSWMYVSVTGVVVYWMLYCS